MSDARSLLRAHRAANRIEHPHAAYSDAGKLLCKICREAVKSDSLWESHTRSESHRRGAAALQASATASTEGSNKRRHDDVDAMGVEAGDELAEAEEAVPKKRNKLDMVGNGIDREKTGTPPSLPRRTSSTPVQGVEISIPSRPATPLIGESPQILTPNLPSLGPPLLLGSGSENAGTSGTNGSVAQVPISTETLAPPAALTTIPVGRNVDEAEWAAFEAEIAAADAPAPSSTTNTYEDATISAAPLTAEQIAAKSQTQENVQKNHLRDVEIADEKEDATRALETEFEEMEELESRVRKLKERREELRKGSMANLRGAARSAAGKLVTRGVKVGVSEKENVADGDGVDSDSDEEDEGEDWDDGFRFRA
ncbi:hypothetical protein BJ170DRAFT_617955 [Xylariales sp. AK1849]|nr:hypothetical protein BJ170DRAFT_617955 [Xylariales sp. AK1849]